MAELLEGLSPDNLEDVEVKIRADSGRDSRGAGPAALAGKILNAYQELEAKSS